LPSRLACVQVGVGLGEQIPGVSEGQAIQRLLEREPEVSRVFVGKGDIPRGRLGQEVDDDLQHALSGLAVEIAHTFLEAGNEPGIPNAGLFVKFPRRRGLRVFSRLDVALGEVPMRSIIEEQILPLRTLPEQDHSGRDLTPHGSSRFFIPRKAGPCQPPSLPKGP
jgi:hypothetical protein